MIRTEDPISTLAREWALAEAILAEMAGNPPVPPLTASPEERKAFEEAFLQRAAARGAGPERARRACRMAIGLGLVEGLLGPEVEELILRGGTAWVLHRSGGRSAFPDLFPRGAVASLAARVADATGRAMTGRRQFVTTDLDRPDLGRLRLSAVLPPMADAPGVNIRLFPREPIPLAALVPPAAREALRALLREPGALLIAGPFAAGKTTLLNALLVEAVGMGMLPVVVEAFRELRLPEGAALMVEAPDPALADEAIAEAVLRMRADLVALGEITAPQEARRFLWVASVGRPALATLHGGSPAQAMAVLRELAARAGMAMEAVEGMIAVSVRAVVQLQYDPLAHRRTFGGIFTPEGNPWSG